MASAKREALSACTSVESMGSAMASMPHYLSKGTNELVASSVDEAVSALKSVLLLSITGVGEILWFVINMMYSTYACLITMAVRGTVGAGIELVKEATEWINKTLKAISGDIESTVDKYKDELNSFLEAINKVASVFTDDPSPINLNSTINTLENLSLPSSINRTVEKLDSAVLPNFKEIQNYTKTLFQTPFQEVRDLVNETLGIYSFDRSVLPIPAKQQLTFCNDNKGINDFFNGVTELALTARKIFIAVLIVAAILVCIPIAWQEIRRWRSMKERSQLVRKEAHDPMDVVYIVSRPYTAAAGIKAASHFSNSRRQILVRWAIAYATSPAALFVLALALAALFSCLCQYLLLHSVKQTVPALSAQVGEFADKVVDSLESASTDWATDANKAIVKLDTELNHDIFGWVNTSAQAINATLNFFIYNTSSVLNETFKGTLLQEPVYELYECLIGLKAEALQTGLNWVVEHAHISLPTLPNDTFSAGASDSIGSPNASDSFLADSGDQTANKITEVVTSVINKLQEAVRMEAIIATVILLLWVFIALIGIIRVMTLFWSREKHRGEGGQGHILDPVHNGGPPSHDPNGFTEVPLTAIPRNMSGDEHTVPRYTAAVTSAPMRSESSSYGDEKIGFAGQRKYEHALQVDTGPDLRGSSYVEYDVKR
ncbi:Plasma membrane fusion protein PRM1 [Penicillium vulpinum]|nr:Plasma membrane fusion protein PRM1 [Penicillium vulpinum]KAJ5972277.1 Plasma membrane fusion protein PRM1 [Penicillium vulpinum]